jgi:hypothetical protein
LHDELASPVPGYVGPLLKHVTVTNDEERASVRQVLEVSEGHVLQAHERSADQTPARSSTYVASQVFLLAEDDLIRIEPSLKVFELLVNSGLVCLTTTQPLTR